MVSLAESCPIVSELRAVRVALSYRTSEKSKPVKNLLALVVTLSALLTPLPGR